MKKSLLFIFIVSLALYANAQSYTSANNGNWTTPTTWNPPGIPYSFTDVTINHNVILDTDFMYNSGSITINSGGSLVQSVPDRRFVINGGSLDNSGIFTVDTFYILTGTFDNAGTSNTSITYSNGIITNTGIMDNIDSLWNNSEIINNGGDMYIDQFYNAYYFYNDGYAEGTNFFNDGEFENIYELDYVNYYNNDTAYNDGEIYFFNHTNAGYCENYYYLIGSNFTNTGEFENYGLLNLSNDFLNVDSIQHNAYFYNDSIVFIANNFLNIDTIDGTVDGQFCVANYSSNLGGMYGYFDFCDQTPPASSPFIDLNTGYFDPNITFCLTPCGTGIVNVNAEEFVVYPNPASDVLTIEYALFQSSENSMISIYSLDGKLIKTKPVEDVIGIEEINVSNIPSGNYFVVVGNRGLSGFVKQISIQHN